MAGKLVIKVNAFGHGSVELDGTDIASSVRAVEFRADANARQGHTEVTLELCVTEIETTYLGSPDREVLVNLTDDVINTLLMLGWTPPENDQRTYRMPVTEWIPSEEFDRLYLNTETPAEVWDVANLPAGCRCFELNHHREYFRDGTHHRECPLFATDNASPDAND